MDQSELLRRASAWAESDPDDATRAEIHALIAAGDFANTDLADRFAGTLEFGTAGLRGVLGAGPNRMNRAVVLRTTHGLAQHLLATCPDASTRGVAIGFDGRIMSREFAEDTACVLAGLGIRSFLFDEVAPTPLTAFAVTHLGAAAGVMVTASHNPPEYNGYKVYWGNGAQIIAPIDIGIANAIEQAPPANKIVRPTLEEAKAQGYVRVLGREVANAYLAEVQKLSVQSGGDRSLRIVYTALHGVGDALVRRALESAGFEHVTSVPEQQEPDGRFPTVLFPNPEEKGAMDLAFKLAQSMRADLVIANDPDADRLAIAVPDAGSASGYMQLTGNQVGVLLGHYLLTGGLSHLDRSVQLGSSAASNERPEPLVVASIVSSPMLGVIANSLGAHYEEVLTGFKWIANLAIRLKKENGLRFLFGFEEALGYTVGELVRDKDGISAAVLFAELTAVLRAQGSSVLLHLEHLYRRYGLFVSSQATLTKKGAEGILELRAIMARLRKNPPSEVGGDDVIVIRDYLEQRMTNRDGKGAPLTLPQSDVLTFELRSGSRIIARPSGTEPKAKFYFDVREPMADGESLADASRRANAKVKTLTEAFTTFATGG